MIHRNQSPLESSVTFKSVKGSQHQKVGELEQASPLSLLDPLSLSFSLQREKSTQFSGEVGGEWGEHSAEDQGGSWKKVPKKLPPPLGVKDHLCRPSPCPGSS